MTMYLQNKVLPVFATFNMKLQDCRELSWFERVSLKRNFCLFWQLFLSLTECQMMSLVQMSLIVWRCLSKNEMFARFCNFYNKRSWCECVYIESYIFACFCNVFYGIIQYGNIILCFPLELSYCQMLSLKTKLFFHLCNFLWNYTARNIVRIFTGTSVIYY